MPRVPDEQALAVLLQDRGAYKVHTFGLKLGGRLYQSEQLGLLVGQTVHARHDSETGGTCWVYPASGGVLAVTEIEKASWQGFGEANKVAKRVERAQRAHLRGLRAQFTGHCTPAELDPTGAFRLVAERLKAEKGEVQRLALHAAERAAGEQEEAAKKAEPRKGEPAGRPLRYVESLLREEAVRKRLLGCDEDEGDAEGQQIFQGWNQGEADEHGDNAVA